LRHTCVDRDWLLLEKANTESKTFSLPSQQNDKHAEECVSTALQLVRAASGILNPAGEQTHLKLGINSGAVCAGVIGDDSPRFTCIGDTVNTASRMASTSFSCTLDEALCIQISDSTRKRVRSSIHFPLTSVHPHARDVLVFFASIMGQVGMVCARSLHKPWAHCTTSLILCPPALLGVSRDFAKREAYGVRECPSGGDSKEYPD